MPGFDGIEAVVSGLGRTELAVREAALQGVIKALSRAYVACEILLSESDHSIIELAKLGHPYGFTHPQDIHPGMPEIHVQSGEYRAALRKISPRGHHGDIVQGRIVNDSPLDRWLQDGTTKMRGRPYMKWVVDKFGDEMAELIAASARSALSRVRWQ